MDHTANYHLPQWEKSDRVMMDDFNQMCAGIDAGLSENKAASDSLASRLTQVDQDARSRDAANAASAQSALKTGLFRNAYNRYHAASVLEPLPRQLGFFSQKLSPEICGSDGFENLLPKEPDAAWLAYGAENLSYVNLADSCTNISDLILNYGQLKNSNAVFTFSPKSPGYFYDILMLGNWVNDSKPAVPPRFRLTMENLDTQTVELDIEIDGVYHASFSSGVWLYGKYYFHRSNYRITVAPVNPNFAASLSIVGQGLFRGVAYNSPAAVLSKTVEVGESSADGFVSLVYEDYGSAAIQLKWDGKSIAPFQTYSYTDSAGRAVKELIWRRGGAVPASTKLQLELSCAVDSDLTLYRWGMALI